MPVLSQRTYRRCLNMSELTIWAVPARRARFDFRFPRRAGAYLRGRTATSCTRYHVDICKEWRFGKGTSRSSSTPVHSQVRYLRRGKKPSQHGAPSQCRERGGPPAPCNAPRADVFAAMDEQQGPELFDAGRIIGPEGPHGVVVRAAVISDELRSEIGPAVAVKIVPVGDRAVGALRAAVRHAMHESAHSGLVRYHGVWPGPGGEAWIVSDLCENRSVAEVLHAARIVDPRELERVVAYVLRNALLAVDAVHAASSVHGDVSTCAAYAARVRDCAEKAWSGWCTDAR